MVAHGLLLRSFDGTGGNTGSDRVFIDQLRGKDRANLLTHFLCAQLTIT